MFLLQEDLKAFVGTYHCVFLLSTNPQTFCEDRSIWIQGFLGAFQKDRASWKPFTESLFFDLLFYYKPNGISKKTKQKIN